MTGRPHTTREFDTELRSLMESVHAMGTHCERGVEMGFAVFRDATPGPHRAQETVNELDQEIARDERDIDALVVTILARRQPVAADLRLLMAAFKLTTDLARVGVDAQSIAAHAEEARGPAKDLALGELERMSFSARQMLHDGVRAFELRDPELARDVIERDAEVDRGYARVLDAMATYVRQDPASAVAAVRVMKVARYLERIADHATNLGEQTIFAVEGLDARHSTRLLAARSPP
jgi:phosphate transport system protein